MKKQDEFVAWWKHVTEYLWGAGTLPTDKKVAKFDPCGCFDEGMSWQAFVIMVDKKLHR